MARIVLFKSSLCSIQEENCRQVGYHKHYKWP